MLPIAGLLGAALVGALAYALLGGGGSAATPTPVVLAVSPRRAPSRTGIAGHAGADRHRAAGRRDDQRVAHRSASGASRNPFAPLPGAKATAATAPAAARPEHGLRHVLHARTATPSSSSAARLRGRRAAADPPAPEARPAPSKPKRRPSTAWPSLFGAVPAGHRRPQRQLTPYENLKRQQPLPSATQPLVVFAV